MAYRLLIVDDSPAMRAFVRRVIGLSGFDMTACFEASNGREALELLRREWVDVILTDINMPCMDGEEFLQQLAANEVLRSIPAIVISTDGTHHRKQRLLAIGARGYLTKPFLPETLRVELESMLGVPA
jgi:two-component system, chemotaxis family, chemotaxis protein CheY